MLTLFYYKKGADDMEKLTLKHIRGKAKNTLIGLNL